jgi:hypothetical protein
MIVRGHAFFEARRRRPAQFLCRDNLLSRSLEWLGFVRHLPFPLVKSRAVQRNDSALQDPRNLNRYGLDITPAQKRSLAGLERTEKQLLMGSLMCHL